MIIEPNDADIALSQQIYERFAAKAGSENIATQFALAGLADLLTKIKPQTVLEFGAGIGTITSLLLTHPANVKRVFCTEDNAFCLEQLALNLQQTSPDRPKILTGPEQLSQLDDNIDLVIVDGGFDGNLAQPFEHVREGTYCYFEGVRRQSREAMVGTLANRGLKCTVVNNRPAGRKLWTFRWLERRILGIPLPKIRIYHRVKGCWIGRVEPLN